ncbi:MAG: GNAT family N-acetyltransferase [Bacteroidota bacterium]
MAKPDDLPLIQAILRDGRQAQQAHQTLTWPEFTDADLLIEINKNCLLKVLGNDLVVGMFCIADEDRAVWGQREQGNHIYLHRIACSAAWTDKSILPAVLEWACRYASKRRRHGLRMDTAAASAKLVGYYERVGFRKVGTQIIGADPLLPSHYHGTEVVLLEMTCATNSA